MSERLYNEKCIYTITTAEKLEESERETLDAGYLRTVGFFHDFADAELAVMENDCDINETIYKYAIIEEIYPGLYPRGAKRFYKFNCKEDRYEPIAKPDCVSDYDVFSIG